MSDRRSDADAAAPSLVPAPLVSVIRDGFGVFLALQSTRYHQPEDMTPPMPAVMMTKTAVGGYGASGQPSLDLSPAEWSELYRQCLLPLGDESVNDLWGLVTTVLQVLADGGAHTVSTGGAICAWYRAFRVDEAYVEQKRQELATMRLSGYADEAVERIGIFFLDLIERSFFAGAFGTAAALMETLMVVLRAGASFNPFSDDVESCLANVKRLLVVSYTDAPSFDAWQRDANDQIFEAKRTLLEGAATSRSAGACVRVAASLCTVALNILLAISGDMEVIRQRCQEAELNVIDYMTALCAISIPFKTLSEMHEVLETLMGQWSKDPENEWMYAAALQLFAVESLGDVVVAMGAVGEIAADHFGWDPSSVLMPAAHGVNTSNEEDEELVNLEEEEKVNSESPAVRRFALDFMAAHLADVCAPPVTALSHEMNLTFTRNDLCTVYTRMFNHHDMLWKAAATYLAYSPFVNPALVYNTITLAAREAALERSAYAGLCSFHRTMLDAGSAHQRLMRRLLKERLSDHPTLTRWLDAFDHYAREAYVDAHRYIIAERFNQGDAAMAAWLAVETQLPSPLQFEIKCLLRGPTSLEDDCVYKVGEAAHNSFIALDVSPTAELAHSLSVCAAISEYRRASAAFSALEEEPQAPVAAVLRSGAWCLQCVERTLTRIDACHFSFHPACIFALVEHGADMLLTMRSILRKVGVSAYANLAGPVLPTLQQAFAVCRVHSGPRRIAAELQAREKDIAEKLSRTIETHTS